MRYLHVLFVVLALAVVAGCGSTAPGLPDDKTIRINLMLDELRSGYAGEPRRCLSTSMYSSVDVASDRYLIFRRHSRSKAWLNELRHPCQGLRRYDTLLFVFHGGNACKMDRVSVADRFVVWKHTGRTCTLGEFTPIFRDDLERIDDLLRRK